MKVYILDKILEYDNNKSIVNAMFQEIDNTLERSNYFFSHLVIDDVQVYEDYEGYFLDNIRNIKEVKVISSTLKELANDTMLSTVEYLNRAIPELDILSNEFYKTPTHDSWSKLSDLLEGIAWIMDSFITIDTNARLKDLVSSYEEWNLYAKNIYSLQEIIRELEDAMKNQDIVSVADILSYEIAPLFKDMKDRLECLTSKGEN